MAPAEMIPARPEPVGVRSRLPLLFLDVDGVLNPYAMEKTPPEGFPGFADFTAHEARGFLLRLSRTMGHRLARLPAEICWATTWAETVDSDVAPFCGLPEGLRVAAGPPGEEAAALANWKLAQVRALVEAERRPFAWLDDDALDWPGPDGRSARQWSEGLDLPSLLLSPRPDQGLTPAEVDLLEAWLAGIGAGEPGH